MHQLFIVCSEFRGKETSLASRRPFCDTMQPLVILSAVLFVVFIDQSEGSALKIFNGREVEPNEYPWTGWLLIGLRRVKCGTTLIAPKFALTAASCASADVVSANFGYHSRTDLNGMEQAVGVVNITQHPDYNATTFENDIAILELDTEVNITGSTVDTIPLLPDDQLTEKILDKHCRAMGWGYEVAGSSDSVRDQSDVLLEVVVDTLDNDTCAAEMAPENTVCYEPFRDPTSLTCEGDIGGPFICKRKQVWTLAGVLSGWNVGTGCMNGARAATVVSSYLPWINSIIMA